MRPVFLLVIAAMSMLAGVQSVPERRDPIGGVRAPGSKQTVPAITNSEGVIAGVYQWKGRLVGFVRSRDGAVAMFSREEWRSTFVEALNEAGVVVGSYEERGRLHGFIRAKDGKIVTFDVSGAEATVPQSLDEDGAISGWYLDRGLKRGFRRDAAGGITTFEVKD